ncbi:hypothetical protein ACFVYD_24945 [Streptomyces sp. NPDC058301]|uniref:hypothetical protein n=1 Tax=Streptomyces sp. NPDC058301 TaxID=3346436 RepID=UPI0036EE02AF
MVRVISKVRLEKSRPWSTGPFWVPPLMLLCTSPVEEMGCARCHQSSSRAPELPVQGRS